MDDVPWWVDKYDDAAWRTAYEERMRSLNAATAKREEEAEEKRKRSEAWRELRKTITTEEADTYIFNLTKFGMSQTTIAKSLGLSSVYTNIRRHRERVNG